ncbi:cell envelope-related transcriptional attenuator [Deinococcus aerius]|uniref:Cell envelope-related transcriptional attenuator n=2 Tax=Deinococcus TaxID=1298 RepID=A0A2I9D376_9DEIO|nr:MULTISPECIES: LCP family protein [Deinococcus]MBB5293921.1 LCP family protein required for cell wall assembly [Deinococcus metallilatus]QBY07140.1 LytR family transcriptional regulator [Deinococcus metallilatus]RXJ14612.1 LytR family transcriptional regulator [Deinococcus metallilatus]TLK30732.1 LytR family transcriptional regulator [Deinococcus metallilatus]GBF04620.1 cell envelope-related transcriptional attenuator [Deinococcus aerius]
MRRLTVPVLVVLAGLVALGAPAVPALTRYGALPRAAGRPVTVLLAGVTPRYQENAAVWPWPVAPEDFTFLTDTLVLAQFWPGGRVNLLSLPRDTWVNLAGYGWGKINGANVKGGPELLVKVVQDLTGVPVDAYVLLSLNAVRALTDAVGGVTLDVPRRMKYDDNAGKLHIDLQPGRQRLRGPQAEGFLRFRKDNLGDLGRVQRQQLYLTALVNRVKNPLNWWRLPAMVGALDRNTRTNLTRAQVGALLGAALGGLQVNTATLPGSFGDGGTWVADHPALHALVREQFRDPNDPRFLTVAVVNAGAPDGSARRLRARLEGLGYQQVVISNGPRAGGPTTVSGKAAAAVQRDMGYGRVTREAGLPGADVTVRLGSDTKAP